MGEQLGTPRKKTKKKTTIKSKYPTDNKKTNFIKASGKRTMEKNVGKKTGLPS